jgi:hypothetical protein
MTIASRPPAWFRRQFPVPPPTAVVALDDWKHQDRKSVWYDSRYYRLNMFWENGGFYIRDLHRFDETVVSPTHATVLTNTSLAYGTLPVMDGCLWSGPDPAGLRPVLLSPAGANTALTPAGPPVVTELTRTELEIRQPLPDGGMFTIVCGEAQVTFSGVDAQARPFAWAWNLIGGAKQKAALQSVTPIASPTMWTAPPINCVWLPPEPSVGNSLRATCNSSAIPTGNSPSSSADFEDHQAGRARSPGAPCNLCWHSLVPSAPSPLPPGLDAGILEFTTSAPRLRLPVVRSDFGYKLRGAFPPGSPRFHE